MDRNFPGVTQIKRMLATGTHVLIRLKDGSLEAGAEQEREQEGEAGEVAGRVAGGFSPRELAARAWADGVQLAGPAGC